MLVNFWRFVRKLQTNSPEAKKSMISHITYKMKYPISWAGISNAFFSFEQSKFSIANTVKKIIPAMDITKSTTNRYCIPRYTKKKTKKPSKNGYMQRFIKNKSDMISYF